MSIIYIFFDMIWVCVDDVDMLVGCVDIFWVYRHDLVRLDAATGSQPATHFTEQGTTRIDNSYTLGYVSCIYCVCVQRENLCATPPLTYGLCPSSET